MTSTGVRRIGTQWGTPTTPSLDDYTWHTADWTECEYLTALDRDGDIVGAWEGQPGSVAFESCPYDDEICVILNGRVAIEVHGGPRHEFGSGESFVIPVSTNAVWHTL